MSMICHDVLTISGQPVACPRPRVTKTGHAFMPAKYKAYKAQAVSELQAQWELEPIKKGCRVVVFYIFQRPKSTPKKQTKRKHKKTKPDIDNLQKSTFDALVQAGVLHDDNVIYEIRATKFIAGINDDPHTQIHILQDR
jgi:Holliday junction resolvase RusA-like endonuclease